MSERFRVLNMLLLIATIVHGMNEAKTVILLTDLTIEIASDCTVM